MSQLQNHEEIETNETFACNICRFEYDITEMYEFDSTELCRDCFEEQTVICGECNERIWMDDSYSDNNIYLCTYCYNEYYNRCTDCDCLVHNNNIMYYNDLHYCQGCYNQIDFYDEYDDGYNRYGEKVINDYYYKPNPIFYGLGIHYGIELEVDGAGKNVDNAEEILDIVNYGNPHIYIKHDGSLTDGFEIVSHPMSLNYHQTVMNWKDVLKCLIGQGYLSHQTSTCGVHVHIEKSALGENSERQDATISNILYFVEKNWNEMLKFSRRTEAQMKRWASRYGYKDSPKELLEHAKYGNFGRYTCVNLQNSQTIEMRLFRGTLKYSTFIATLQFVDQICSVAFSMSSDEMKSLTWSEFVRGIGKEDKSELIEYLKTKDLYVNEPVIEQQEEI